MKNFVFCAVVKDGSNFDGNRHGVTPVILEPIQGVSPRGINVLDGTVADGNGIEVGKAYVFKAIELDPEDKGFNPKVANRQFNFSKLVELSEDKVLDLALMNDIKILISDPTKDTWVKGKAKADESTEEKPKKAKKKKAKTEEPVDEVN